MAKVALTEQYLEDIADALRAKSETSNTYTPAEMAPAILALPAGGGIIPTGTISITTNGTHNVYNYASADVQVSSTINNQNKTVNPSTSQQSITADSGYTGLGTVTVNAMPSGTAGTPEAYKMDIIDHTMTIGVGVVNTAGYIPGGTVIGSSISVSASELVSGNKSITANGTNIDVTNYATVSVNVSGGGGATIDSLSVTPTESEQTFNSSSVDGYKPVVVAAISSTYIGSGITTYNSIDGGIDATSFTYTNQNNTPKINVGMAGTTGYYNISESGASVYKQGATTITPTESQQTAVNANTWVTGAITVGAIDSEYVGSLVPRVTSTDITVSGPTVTMPNGFYSTELTKTVASGSARGPSSLSGTSASVSTGTNTLTLTKTNVSTTPTVSAGYVSSATASTATVTLTASVTTKAAATYHPSTTAQSISSGTYLTGAQTIAAVTTSNLSASNIVSGVTIKVGDSSDDDCVASVTGNVVLQHYYTGSSAPSSSTGSNGDLYLQS